MKAVLISCCHQSKWNLSASCHIFNYINSWDCKTIFSLFFFLNFVNDNITRQKITQLFHYLETLHLRVEQTPISYINCSEGREAKWRKEIPKTKTPSHPEIVRKITFNCQKDYIYWQHKIPRVLIWDSPFSPVSKVMILHYTLTFLCRKWQNFCLNGWFSIGSLTLSQITSVSLMPYDRFPTENPNHSNKPDTCVAPCLATLNAQAISFGWCSPASWLDYYWINIQYL